MDCEHNVIKRLFRGVINEQGGQTYGGRHNREWTQGEQSPAPRLTALTTALKSLFMVIEWGPNDTVWQEQGALKSHQGLEWVCATQEASSLCLRSLLSVPHTLHSADTIACRHIGCIILIFYSIVFLRQGLV